MLDASTRRSGPHIFPDKGDGADPRLCPTCGTGRLSLKTGKFGAFIGCSNYPECRFTRAVARPAPESAEGERPGDRELGVDPATGEEIWLNGRFGPYVQQGEGEKPKRRPLPRDWPPDDVTLEKALALLSLPREVARHPTSGEPILAGIGRYGPYVQHGKTYANLGTRRRRSRDRRQSRHRPHRRQGKRRGAARFGAGGRAACSAIIREGGAITVKQGRFGAYVNHGKINATLPKGTNPDTLTLDEAVAMLDAKAAGGGVTGRLLGQHPDGGPITVRDGRFGAYVNWGKVNATIPKSTAPRFHRARRGARADRRARGQAGRRAARPGENVGGATAAPGKGAGQAGGLQPAPARAKPAAPKKPAAKTAAAAKPKSATLSKRT